MMLVATETGTLFLSFLMPLPSAHLSVSAAPYMRGQCRLLLNYQLCLLGTSANLTRYTCGKVHPVHITNRVNGGEMAQLVKAQVW